MIYCEDCRFFTVPSGGVQFARCARPEAARALSFDRFVSKELDKPPEQMYCSTMRADLCGDNAKLFEPKP